MDDPTLRSRIGRLRASGSFLATALLAAGTLTGLVGAGLLGTPVAGRDLVKVRFDGAKPVTVGSARVTGLTTGTVAVDGSGYGHGVGLSQYGALGMARAGTAVSGILTHYYTGTTVTGYPDRVDVRVNVVDRGTQVVLTGSALAPGGGAVELISAGGTVFPLPVGDSATVTIEGSSLAVALASATGTPRNFTTAGLTVRWAGARGMAGQAGLLQVASRTANATSTSSRTRRYRWGSLRMTPVARSDSDGAVRTRVEAVAVVDLHSEYLRGVAEMPSSWPAAALQAQVVAARNYALAAYRRGTQTGCGGCNLYDDTRSQVYSGWAKESESIGGVRYGDRWVTAVRATQTSSTAGLSVLYHGVPVTAYFSSSSGGYTRDAASAWGTSVPYLKSVPDPWSIDPSINPGFAHWTRSVAVAKLTTLFGLSDLAALTVTQRDSGGAVTMVNGQASDGTVSTVKGEVFRSRLGLPAAWVNAFVLPSPGGGGSAPTPTAPTPAPTPSSTATASTTTTPTQTASTSTASASTSTASKPTASKPTASRPTTTP